MNRAGSGAVRADWRLSHIDSGCARLARSEKKCGACCVLKPVKLIDDGVCRHHGAGLRALLQVETGHKDRRARWS